MNTTTTLSLNTSAVNDPFPSVLKKTVSKPDIAFIGRMGSGKTTAAEVLVGEYGYWRKGFAHVLRDVAHHIWGDESFHNRGLLQQLGVAVREIDENAWVNALMHKLDQISGPVVIDDCRFPNEYWALKERGFVFVRVEADELFRVSRLLAIDKLQDHAQLEHVSETSLDDVKPEYTVVNEADLDVFHERLHDVQERVQRAVL